MIKALCFSLVCSVGLCAAPLPDPTVNKIVDSIYKLEGGDKTRYPYGIKSIPIKGDTAEARRAYARRICRNTVVNNWRRWEDAGGTGSYFVFLATRYCPPSADPVGHKNWINNIRKISGLDL